MTDLRLGIIVEKIPAGYQDIKIDWTDPSRGLGNDTIDESAWAFQGADDTLVLNNGAIVEAGKKTVIWIGAGTLGNYYTVTNTITTHGGRILTETFLVYIVSNVYLTPPDII